MASLEDEDESPEGSSDEVDETMEDLDDGDADAAADADADADADNDEENEENEDDDDQDDTQDLEDALSRQQQPNKLSTSHGSPLRNGQNNTDVDKDQAALKPHEQSATSRSPRQSVTPGSNLPLRPNIRPEAINAGTYDIVPTIAAPHSTSINAVTATPGMRWVFSGGADGYIRKFNWIDTVNAKSMLTVAQRHPFVDSITKAGVLMSYWENEEATWRSPVIQPQDESTSMSPVYSLAVHHQGLWLLSGLETGGINLQAARHDEGKRISTLRKHTSAVSVLVLAKDEKSVLSGSWDKSIIDWDLNTGQVRRSYSGSGGQISALEMRPESFLPVPLEPSQPSTGSMTMLSNNAYGSVSVKNDESSHVFTNEDGTQEAPGSPNDSLGSLFGDNDDTVNVNHPGPTFDDDDDDFSRAIAKGIEEQDQLDADGDLTISGDNALPAPALNKTEEVGSEVNSERMTNGIAEGEGTPVANGLPHSEEFNGQEDKHPEDKMSADIPPSSDNVFLDAAHDGTLRIWDRRQPNPVAKIVPARNVPPWCMNACWSHDGNFIYAGRRNSAVDEYSLHKGFREPNRTFRFPAGSGAVSAVRAMPNGRHLVCASYDILRLYDLKDSESAKHSTVPFLIVPGHRTGVVSQLYLDPTCTFMISTAGNRGWDGSSTEVLLGYEIGVLNG